MKSREIAWDPASILNRSSKWHLQSGSGNAIWESTVWVNHWSYLYTILQNSIYKCNLWVSYRRQFIARYKPKSVWLVRLTMRDSNPPSFFKLRAEAQTTKLVEQKFNRCLPVWPDFGTKRSQNSESCPKRLQILLKKCYFTKGPKTH